MTSSARTEKRRGVAADDVDEGPRQHHAEHGAGAAEHQALGEQRAPERAGAGAERRTHGQLAFAAHRARQDQIGDVRARNHEHDGRRGQQHEQNRPRGRGDLIAERRDAQLRCWRSPRRPRGARA